MNKESKDNSYLTLNWPAKPNNVYAVCTLIQGGFSSGDYASFNLATHVGDDFTAVTANRKKLKSELELPSEPVWLEQVHSSTIIETENLKTAGADFTQATVQADASISRTPGVVCVVLTADCLPVFICDRSGTEIAVVHAGWRGLHAGIIKKTIAAMHAPVSDLVVYLGPAIGPQAFEVGQDVYNAFVDKNHQNISAFFTNNNEYFLCDIYRLAQIELQALGINQARITGGNHCTFTEKNRFYSYRRRKRTGRMANLIWME